MDIKRNGATPSNKGATLDFTPMLDHRRKPIADVEFEERIDALEQASRQRGLREK